MATNFPESEDYIEEDMHIAEYEITWESNASRALREFNEYKRMITKHSTDFKKIMMKESTDFKKIMVKESADFKKIMVKESADLKKIIRKNSEDMNHTMNLTLVISGAVSATYILKTIKDMKQRGTRDDQLVLKGRVLLHFFSGAVSRFAHCNCIEALLCELRGLLWNNDHFLPQ
ncbi:hypothetical protein C5167_045331 [Papaver somniferum]|uniref:Uncharacterized protein n=1 Tax=Papaver somniferum TaxID=3469 RepID=A0A4Y7LED8_PAPSO|nr:hypothetical protein C5167_045331 [Papaver somniferum]